MHDERESEAKQHLGSIAEKGSQRRPKRWQAQRLLLLSHTHSPHPFLSPSLPAFYPSLKFPLQTLPPSAPSLLVFLHIAKRRTRRIKVVCGSRQLEGSEGGARPATEADAASRLSMQVEGHPSSLSKVQDTTKTQKALFCYV